MSMFYGFTWKTGVTTLHAAYVWATIKGIFLENLNFIENLIIHLYSYPTAAWV